MQTLTRHMQSNPTSVTLGFSMLPRDDGAARGALLVFEPLDGGSWVTEPYANHCSVSAAESSLLQGPSGGSCPRTGRQASCLCRSLTAWQACSSSPLRLCTWSRKMRSVPAQGQGEGARLLLVSFLFMSTKRCSPCAVNAKAASPVHCPPAISQNQCRDQREML